MVSGDEPMDLLGGVVDLRAGAAPVRAESPSNPEPDDWHVFRIDDEMVEAAEMYRDTLRSYISDGDVVEYECRLDMRHIHPDLFGTGDALIYKPRTRHLIVCDFKYGSGIAVDVKDNEQLLTYAVGALARFNRQVDRLTLIIVQPRAFHVHGPVRSQDLDIVDLLLFEGFLRERAAKTDDVNAPACAGLHCRFCPVAFGCQDLRRYVFDLIGISRRFMKELTDHDMPAVMQMSSDDLGRVMREIIVIESWLKRVMAYAHDRALKGDVPTGMKLVDKRAYRKWKNSEAARERALEMGFDEESILTEPKLLTVAQLEKVIGKKDFADLFDDLYAQESSGYVLALEEDHRAPARLDKGDAFGAADDE